MAPEVYGALPALTAERRLIVWMMHPLAGDIVNNLARSKRWLKWLIRTFPDIDFEAGWILWCELLDDTVPTERARGLAFDSEMIRRLDAVCVVGGRVSRGMVRELAVAYDHKKPVADLTSLGDEPPAAGVMVDLHFHAVLP